MTGTLREPHSRTGLDRNLPGVVVVGGAEVAVGAATEAAIGGPDLPTSSVVQYSNWICRGLSHFK